MKNSPVPTQHVTIYLPDASWTPTMHYTMDELTHAAVHSPTLTPEERSDRIAYALWLSDSTFERFKRTHPHGPTAEEIRALDEGLPLPPWTEPDDLQELPPLREPEPFDPVCPAPTFREKCQRFYVGTFKPWMRRQIDLEAAYQREQWQSFAPRTQRALKFVGFVYVPTTLFGSVIYTYPATKRVWISFLEWLMS